LNVYLIEGSINRNSFDFTVGFPETFFRHMEILPNRISTGIPPTHFLCQGKMKRVVRERECDIEHANEVVTVHGTMELIVHSCDDRDIKMVSCVDLIWLIDKSLSFL
jgi:hypothetical protein